MKKLKQIVQEHYAILNVKNIVKPALINKRLLIQSIVSALMIAAIFYVVGFFLNVNMNLDYVFYGMSTTILGSFVLYKIGFEFSLSFKYKFKYSNFNSVLPTIIGFSYIWFTIHAILFLFVIPNNITIITKAIVMVISLILAGLLWYIDYLLTFESNSLLLDGLKAIFVVMGVLLSVAMLINIKDIRTMYLIVIPISFMIYFAKRLIPKNSNRKVMLGIIFGLFMLSLTTKLFVTNLEDITPALIHTDITKEEVILEDQHRIEYMYQVGDYIAAFIPLEDQKVLRIYDQSFEVVKEFTHDSHIIIEKAGDTYFVTKLFENRFTDTYNNCEALDADLNHIRYYYYPISYAGNLYQYVEYQMNNLFPINDEFYYENHDEQLVLLQAITNDQIPDEEIKTVFLFQDNDLISYNDSFSLTRRKSTFDEEQVHIIIEGAPFKVQTAINKIVLRQVNSTELSKDYSFDFDDSIRTVLQISKNNTYYIVDYIDIANNRLIGLLDEEGTILETYEYYRYNNETRTSYNPKEEVNILLQGDITVMHTYEYTNIWVMDNTESSYYAYFQWEKSLLEIETVVFMLGFFILLPVPKSEVVRRKTV